MTMTQNNAKLTAAQISNIIELADFLNDVCPKVAEKIPSPALDANKVLDRLVESLEYLDDARLELNHAESLIDELIGSFHPQGES